MTALDILDGKSERPSSLGTGSRKDAFLLFLEIEIRRRLICQLNVHCYDRVNNPRW